MYRQDPKGEAFIKTQEIVVVGAGLGGLCAAHVLLNRGFSVTVVDGARDVGGLLQSESFGTDVFDFGPHLIAETQVPEIDAQIVAPFVKKYMPWAFRQSPTQGHVYNGKFNDETSCPDLRTLAPTLLARARSEFLEAEMGEPISRYRTAKDWTVARYGRTIAEEFYAPTVRKLSGAELAELDPTAPAVLGIPRVVLFGSAVACELKQDPKHDERLAFAKSTDGNLPGKIYYPRHGGIQSWVNYLRATAEAKGALFRLGEAVEGLTVRHGIVEGIRLRSGEVMPCSGLLWTAAPEFLLRCLGGKSRMPQHAARDVQLYHFLVEGQYNTAAFWVTNFDSRYLSYRTTLYDNFAPSLAPGFLRLTVEVLVAPGAEQIDYRVLNKELAESGIISRSQQTILVGTRVLARAFPTPLVGSRAARKETVGRAGQSATNVFLAGGGNAVSGQVAVIRDAWAVASNCFFEQRATLSV